MNSLLKNQTTFVQESELDRAHTVIVHEPMDEVFFSSLHPSGSLYERGTSTKLVRDANRELQKTFAGRAINVVKITDVLESASHENLLQIASSLLEYFYHGDMEQLAPDLRSRIQQQLSDEYKLEALKDYGNKDLVRVIINRPRVHLNIADKNTPLVLEFVELRPLGNLVFTRDPQIVTDKGVVIGHLNSPQREGETLIMERVFEILKIPVVGKCPSDCFLEGGDFIPVGDHAFLGIGLRSNFATATYLMDNRLVGYPKFVIVQDTTDLNQDRMHLDTFFNIIGHRSAVILDSLTNRKLRRTAIEFTRQEDGFIKTCEMDFVDYLEQVLQYQLISVCEEHQLAYAVNFVQLGGEVSDIITINPLTESYIKQSKVQGLITYVEFEGIKRMYGAGHCSTQIFRTPNTHPRLP